MQEREMFYQIHTNLAQGCMEYYYLEVNQKTFFVECLMVLLYQNNQYLSLYILEMKLCENEQINFFIVKNAEITKLKLSNQ